MLLLPNVTADFSERYAVPAMPAVCLAAALAFVRVQRGAAAPGPAGGPPADDRLTAGAPGQDRPDDDQAAGAGGTDGESADTAAASLPGP
jgi:hypothetical protein